MRPLRTNKKMNCSIQQVQSFRLFRVFLFSVLLLLIAASSSQVPTTARTAKPDECLPAIEFTAPAYSSMDDLRGSASCVNFLDYKVAVYIYVSGWWNKPTWAEPLTPIQNDGSWTCDITTGGSDPWATKIAAFLVPNGYTPPLLSGQQNIPEEVYQNAMAKKFVDRPPYKRTLQFSGYTWGVKASPSPVGPGPNNFSDLESDVFVDDTGRLHLKIVQRAGTWYCTEIVHTQSLGYGTYTFTLASPVDQLDPNVVLGLFTWDDAAPQYNYREVDIEISRWGDLQALNSQYVIQPYTQAGNMHRFATLLQGSLSTHLFDWRKDVVQFSSYQGNPANPGDQIQAWTYSGADNPPPGAENTRLNLWLMNGSPPSDGQEVEVVVESFTFTPGNKNYFPIVAK
jgi:hypothetical protein